MSDKINENIIIEFTTAEGLSNFIKALMDSKNGKECFVKLYDNGNYYAVELKQGWS